MADYVGAITLVVGFTLTIVVIVTIDLQIRHWHSKKSLPPLSNPQQKKKIAEVAQVTVEETPIAIPVSPVDLKPQEKEVEDNIFDAKVAISFALAADKATLDSLCILAQIHKHEYTWQSLHTDTKQLERLWPWICLLKRPTLKS